MSGSPVVPPHARPPIYWIGGSKGGVGKSMVTAATVDYLIDRGPSPLLVECDTSNPDVWNAYGRDIRTELVDLDQASGWIDLVNICADTNEHPVVINTAARNNLAVRRYGSTLDSSLQELARALVTLWVINRQRDGLELLKEFVDAVPHAHIHVVRNGYFGDEPKFELYNQSQLRKVIEANGGRSITFPDLADRVADDLYTRRLTLAEAAKTLPIGNRAELARWRARAREVLTEVLA